MITPALKEQILDQLDIVQLIGKYVALKQKGHNHYGLCPFHNEKTPSFTVSPAKGIFKCFGCGEGGNAIDFVIKHNKLSFPEAIRFLAKDLGIDIPEQRPDPATAEKIKYQEKLKKFHEFAASFFIENLNNPLYKVANGYALSRFSKETLTVWRVGFAPQGKSLYNAALNSGYDKGFLIKTGLFCEDEKTGNVYDYFRNRLMFPVCNRSGQVIGFTGRIIPDFIKPGTDPPKWLNSRDSEIYHKNETLFGINFAANAFGKKGAVVCEGAGDCIALHDAGEGGAIASCGTSLSSEQLDYIKRYTDKITFIYDADEAGDAALLRNSRMAIEKRFKVFCLSLPNDQDPESFFKDPEHYKKFMAENRKDFIVWRAIQLYMKTGLDPVSKNEIYKYLGELISFYDNSLRQVYTSDVAKALKIKQSLISDRFKDLDLQLAAANEEKLNLPHGVDAKAAAEYGFYDYKNRYYFRTRDSYEALSNFIMNPLFHIEGSEDSRRFYELLNCYGRRIVVDLDMQEMTSIQAFRRNVEGRGNFLWFGNDQHFTRVKTKLYEQTRTAREIKILGWQKQGFWAWANGITDKQGVFTEIDELGLVCHDGQDYYIPAFSKVFIDDKSVYLQERRFKFIDRKISLREYSDLFRKVFGKNAELGLCYWLAAVFRDYVLFAFKNFPILNLFGPKGTGKSQMAVSLCSLFGESQIPFNIHNGTKPGLAEHVQQFSNAFAWIDEYKNNLEFDKIETLKSLFDSIGRNRLNTDRRKETTQVNAATILSGQEMPTSDVALFSRLIFLQFNQAEFSQEEKHNYDRLKEMERDGLSHLTNQLIKFRDYFVKHFYSNYDSVLSEVYSILIHDGIEDRILRNWCTLAACLKTLEDKIDLGFSYQSLKPKLIESIRHQNIQVHTSDEIAAFWNIFEALYDENLLIEGWHFRIDLMDTIKQNKGERKLAEPCDILRFKYNALYMLYSERSRRMGAKPLPADTLRYYLENYRFFEGVFSSTKFYLKEFKDGQMVEQKQITSAYCFRYDKIGINLRRTMATAEDTPSANGNYVNGAVLVREPSEMSHAPADEDLPF